MLEQLRVNWITSPERTALINALHHQMTQRLLAVMPGSPVSALASELATAAIAQFDLLVTQPVQVQANKVVIKDHRG